MLKTIRRIGASQLATVSECQMPPGKHFALKEFNRQPLTPLQRERIFGAAARWKKLSMSGLVPYWEVSAEQNQISMELLDRSAAIRLREGPSDPRLVLHTIRGTLLVLAQLHEQGLLHVNLKPTNVFFDTGGRVRLSDGLLIDARLPVALPPPLNFKYMAPEQASNDFGPISPASDLYCVGLLALELLAGDRFARAFQGISADAPEGDMAWSQWHGSSQTAPSANLFAKGCPEELERLIARLVAKQPSLRYATARQALQDLPQDISGQTQPATANKPVASEKKREALATHVISRPATGIVLAIASGSRAGEMIGSNENELMIGFDHDCFVRFSRDHYPNGGSKVLLRRGPQGWYALRVSGDSAFVNQHVLEEKCPLRSGDIVRLTSCGPDVQFTMQSGGVAIRSLVERFLPSQSAAALSSGTPNSAELAATAAAAAAVGPRGTFVSAPPSGPAKATPASTASAPTDRALGNSAAQIHQPASVANSQAGNRAADNGSRSNHQPAWPKRRDHDSESRATLGTRLDRLCAWLDPRTWSAMVKNIAMGLLGALLVILVVSLLARLFSSSRRPAEVPAVAEPAGRLVPRAIAR